VPERQHADTTNGTGPANAAKGGVHVRGDGPLAAGCMKAKVALVMRTGLTARMQLELLPANSLSNKRKSAGIGCECECRDEGHFDPPVGAVSRSRRPGKTESQP